MDGEKNADYVSQSGLIAELKIIEEEGIEKATRQTKIAELYEKFGNLENTVDITLEHSPSDLKRELESIVSEPLKHPIKEASKQIQQSKAQLNLTGPGVLIVVNNGYSYLNAENFSRLIVRRCQNDASAIDYATCITVDYHQGPFDAYVFCETSNHTIRGNKEWREGELLRDAVMDAFGRLMTEMMGDQMNPKLWDKSLGPIIDIEFLREGVRYVRKAPYFPDSRFE
jgi:hypothetical protein